MHIFYKTGSRFPFVFCWIGISSSMRSGPFLPLLSYQESSSSLLVNGTGLIHSNVNELAEWPSSEGLLCMRQSLAHRKGRDENFKGAQSCQSLAACASQASRCRKHLTLLNYESLKWISGIPDGKTLGAWKQQSTERYRTVPRRSKCLKPWSWALGLGNGLKERLWPNE